MLQIKLDRKSPKKYSAQKVVKDSNITFLEQNIQHLSSDCVRAKVTQNKMLFGLQNFNKGKNMNTTSILRILRFHLEFPNVMDSIFSEFPQLNTFMDNILITTEGDQNRGEKKGLQGTKNWPNFDRSASSSKISIAA